MFLDQHQLALLLHTTALHVLDCQINSETTLIVRKPSVMSGNTDWASSGGTDAENSEWTVHPQNYWDDA